MKQAETNFKMKTLAAKLLAKTAKIAADKWPCDECFFWSYSPKKPKSMPKLDAPLKK